MKAPEFIQLDPAQTIADLVAEYQTQTGKVLQASQPEQLLINTFAYLLELQKNQIQQAGEQSLIDFATAPALDRLASLLGVSRLEAKGATTTILFTLVVGHGGVTIPAGTRIATTDGQQIFQTQQEIVILAGTNTATATLNAQIAGAGANGFSLGTISVILDPQAFLESATNTTISAGGANAETDEQLRERAKLAPSSFSTAGSIGAYVFYTKTASQLIIDVSIINDVPGTVSVYPLIAGGGTTPPEIIADVLAALNAETVRPLTDFVAVASPTAQAYAIEINVTLRNGFAAQPILDEIETNLLNYADAKGTKIGQDIVLSQIIAEAGKVAGVYEIATVSPVTDIVISPIQVAQITTITVNLIGYNE
jgi:phage-related baseplate assembly protein